MRKAAKKTAAPDMYQLSGFPVDFAILFGPGLIPMIMMVFRL